MNTKSKSIKFVIFLFISLLISFLIIACSCTQNKALVNNIHKQSQFSQDFENKLNEYAKVLISIGLNVQKGDNVKIVCPVGDAYFGYKCITEAYNAGASFADIIWSDNYVNHEKKLKSNYDSIKKSTNYANELKNRAALERASILTLMYLDPDGDDDVDPNNGKAFSEISNAALKDYMNLSMNNEIVWSVAAIPQERWAKKIFPDMSEDEAVSKLWDYIFDDVRVKGDGTAVDLWKDHIAKLDKWKNKMNEYNFASLHYTNSLGTDLDVQLPDNHTWLPATNTVASTGHVYVPNIPTEEIYTAPKRTGVNGVIHASRPLVLGGSTVVDGMTLEFKDGKMVKCHADKGEDSLKAALEDDENASYLGECALVPCDSTIFKQNTIYYNTLFDENASCHFAFGFAYPGCVKDGEKMNDNQLEAAGINQSDTHIDFMVGTDDLKIVGKTKDGQEITFFEDGNFVF